MREEETMRWSEQAEDLAKAWAEAQKKIWESWFDLIRVAPGSTPLSQPAADQWRELALQGLKSWTAESEQVVKDVAERLATTQDVVMRFLDLSISAWKAMAPQIESGEDWHTCVKKYADHLRQQLLQFPQDATQAAQDTDELRRLYLEEWQKLVQPWAESLRRVPWHAGQAATGDGSAAIKVTNLYWDAYERTFGRLLESPSLGHTRELTQDLLKGFDAWVDSRRAILEYQSGLAEAWAQALEQFVRKLVSLAEKGETIESLVQLLNLWIDVIEGVFTTRFRSEDYLQKQSRLVNTVMAYRLIERDIVEAFLKTSHLPSRSELDEAYRRIYELRREVKELKKSLRDIKAELSDQPKKGSHAAQSNGPTPDDRGQQQTHD
ncbi:MAG: class III poly(R)-hydroxyalkanoic acid synthase subunit PhaE [Nitrospiraceae bacterium]